MTMTPMSMPTRTNFPLIGQPSLPAHWNGVAVWLTQTGLPLDAHAPNWVDSVYGFNLGVHVGEDVPRVLARRHVLQTEVACPIAWLNQVHGCGVVHIDGVDALHAVSDADASFTLNRDIALAIMTADCLPVVFVALDEHSNAVGIAAAHAGWKGLLSGVLQASVAALMRSLDGRCTRVECFLGPAIGPDSFEVGAEVRDAFLLQNVQMTDCFRCSPWQEGHYLADLYALARCALRTCGVNAIYGGGLDTLTDLRWFSHRRGLRHTQPTGRFATLIRLIETALGT